MPNQKSSQLVINTDGGARGNPGHSGIGVVVRYQNQVVAEVGEYIGVKTNNEVEYLAFIKSLSWLKEHQSEFKISQVVWQLDSLLVVEQLNRKWKVKEDRLRLFAVQIWSELAMLGLPYVISHVPRAQNALADAVVNQILDAQAATPALSNQS